MWLLFPESACCLQVNQIGTISEAIKACQMSQAQVQIYVCMYTCRCRIHVDA
jgi:enolase